MIIDEKSLQLIVQLNRFTSMGEIQWTVQEPPIWLRAGTDAVIPLYLEARYKTARYALYQIRQRSYDGERDMLYWTEDVVLAVLDDMGRSLWETVGGSALWDLLNTARMRLVSLDSLLNDLSPPG
ncbi:hypothetical protein IQ288_34825 [Burkholderia sp. R-69980]|jgi:hypothetical protein|nr:hypothetical protein [Burkholderia sp. R-69980]